LPLIDSPPPDPWFLTGYSHPYSDRTDE
jgi:hypothetical protein